MAVCVLLLVLVAFVVGRFTSGGGPTAVHKVEVPAQSAADEKGGAEHDSAPGEEKKSGEKGIVRFDEESLKLAKLRVEPVAQHSARAQLQVTGTVEPNLAGVVKITPRVAGKVTSVLVNVGEAVRGGQLLATLASTELAQAQAAYRQAAARVQVGVTNLERQRQLARLGQFGRPRVDEARGADAVVQGELDVAQSELAAARNEVAEARTEKATAESEVTGAEAQVVTAQSEIAEAEGQVRSLRAAQSQAQTAVKTTKSRFDRADSLLKDGIVSKQDWEQAQAEYQRAQADAEAAQANIGQGQARVDAAKARMRAAQAQVRAMQGKVQQAAAKIETVQSRQAQVEAKFAATRKRGEISGQVLSREQQIYRGGFLTSKEIVEAEAAWRQAQAEQRAAAETIRLLGGTPGGGNVLSIVAPIGGRVTERLVTLGETVTPEKSLFTITNLASVWVQLSVYAQDLPTIRIGQAVTVLTDAYPGRTFVGAVSNIGDQVDETTRAVKVRCVIQNAGNALRPQTFVRGTIAAGADSPVVSVHKDAVQSVEGKSVVFVAEEHPGEFRSREVETGETVAGQTRIVAGLKPGERIVTRGAFMVKAQAMKSELKDSD